MYMLNNVELKTASWGTSHSIFLNVVLKSPIFIQKFLSLEFDIELDNLVIWSAWVCIINQYAILCQTLVLYQRRSKEPFFPYKRIKFLSPHHLSSLKNKTKIKYNYQFFCIFFPFSNVNIRLVNQKNLKHCYAVNLTLNLNLFSKLKYLASIKVILKKPKTPLLLLKLITLINL